MSGAMLQAVFVPNGSIVEGYLVGHPDLDESSAVKCEIAYMCGGEGTPVVVWLPDMEMPVGECVDCLKRSAECRMHDQEVSLVDESCILCGETLTDCTCED